MHLSFTSGELSPIKETMIPQPEHSAPDRDASTILSTTLRRSWLPLTLLASLTAGAATVAQDYQGAPPAGQGPAASSAPLAVPARPAPVSTSDPLWSAVQTWDRLQQSDSYSFDEYSRFLLAHPGWPGESQMRRAAERRIDPNSYSPQGVATFFTRFPPLSGAGRVRHAEALGAIGRVAEARVAALSAWTGGAISADDEARLLGRFAGQFGPLDHDRRMERLLWDRSTAAATRHIVWTSAARRPLYEARLALQSRAPDAASKAAMLGPGADRDPGFLVDRANWLRDIGQSPAARAYLARPRTLDAPPLDAEKFLETMLTMARGAATDNQSTLAFEIARQIDDIFPAGTIIRDQSFGARDDYTSLTWLGGITALKKLGRPADAVGMFTRYAAAAQTPQSQTKGLYWAGRAAQAAGDMPSANSYYAQAASQVDQFYGQLAAERIGRPLMLPAETAQMPIPPGEQSAFQNREIVRAARLLGQQGRWQDQSLFLRTIAQSAKTDLDHRLAGELGTQIGRPDLGVMVSRVARVNGGRDPIRIGFPTLTVPATMQSHWTMIHAITRQESQFDRQATSRVGAKGMMQLMPATAREQAGKLGMPFDQARLVEPAYNVMLGSSFYDRMLNYYGGNHVLAVASYNAGPGNVNKFIRANGDPRMGGIDVIDWIEAIPLSETRGYVQRVLENAVVYDLLNPGRARTPTVNRLSYYLGKRVPG
jgi:soluble lytic murein transglycosylase